MTNRMMRGLKKSDTSKHGICRLDDDEILYVNVDTLPAVTGSVGVNNFPTSYNSNIIGEYQNSDLIFNGAGIFYALSPAGTTRFMDFAQIADPIPRRTMGYFTNVSSSVINVSVQNIWTNVSGQKMYSEIDSFKAPPVARTLFSATAWSSCFTSIGGVLADLSGNLNDNVPPGAADVPFAFGAVNDAIYFGATTQFKGVLISVGTAGVYDASGIWEYWNGAAWSTLTVESVYPGTSTAPFKTAGGFGIGFEMKYDWAAYDIAGDPTSQYWIRYRITSFTSRTTTPSLITGYYVSYASPSSYGFICEGSYNTEEGVRIVLSNDTTLTDITNIPTFVEIRRI